MGWLVSRMNALYFYKSVFKESEISPRQAGPRNQASSPWYEHPLTEMKKNSKEKLFQ